MNDKEIQAAPLAETTTRVGDDVIKDEELSTKKEMDSMFANAALATGESRFSAAHLG